MRRLVRTRLGSKFSEAARLLWGLKEREGLSNAELAPVLGCNQGHVSKLLWGDILPSRQQAAKLSEYTAQKTHRPHIDALLWDAPSIVADFEPPTVAGLREQLAEDEHMDEGEPLDRRTEDATIPGHGGAGWIDPEFTDSTPTNPEATP